MTNEDRLRELMHDPGWSLPPWRNAERRIRRTARRQRAVTAGLAMALAMVLAGVALAASPVLRPGTAPVAGGPSHHVTRGANRPHPSPSPSRQFLTPPVGSTGFPAAIYPAALRPRPYRSTLALCPAPAGLERPGPATPAAAAAVLRELSSGFRADLRVSDRSAWPFLATSWKAGGIPLFAEAARSAPRYSGPLRPRAALTRAVLGACGTQVANATWVIVTHGSRLLFVTRRNHMLFYSLA
ncbi:MAG TPA: hypothetical protein VEV63_06420 [Streptosporangiaceae bacterium]|nr:hypothetical protein [Streptosporangiaceae bacterium]